MEPKDQSVLKENRVLSDLWVKKEATVHKDCQDWKDHPDPKDLKAKLDPKEITDLLELPVLRVLLESCLFYHRSCCSRETLRRRDARNAMPQHSTKSKIATNGLLL